MSRKGNCWDNAVAESFFSTLKNELIWGGGSNRHHRPNLRSSTTSRSFITDSDYTNR
ncbi:IS1501-like protein transposase [Salinisphaera shabanensis E1L3A]|uniref:IS1501-like protein transposase n=1 Tax=Salinisphaera shabanensis E1L3A TaxID=1033802 RepID=U2ENK0_9GAMM|nr:IS1501-like protein transposase [Salinisphaera shabanensis E1L3A]